MILEIRTHPDPILRMSCLSVGEIDDKFRMLVEDMIETMQSAGGVGLAAPQVGRRQTFFVMDWDGPQVFINPEIELVGKRVLGKEGCLSLPGGQYIVPRALSVKVRATDLNGFTFDLGASGTPAIIIQHEVDHLRGRLLIDYPKPTRRRR
jgi:peptide deformylase